MSKEFMPWIKSIRTRHKLAKTKQILKAIWDLLPLAWIINLMSKVFIVGAVIHYLDSIGSMNWIIHLILMLWIFMSFKNMIHTAYWTWKENRYNNFINSTNLEEKE